MSRASTTLIAPLRVLVAAFLLLLAPTLSTGVAPDDSPENRVVSAPAAGGGCGRGVVSDDIAGVGGMALLLGGAAYAQAAMPSPSSMVCGNGQVIHFVPTDVPQCIRNHWTDLSEGPGVTVFCLADWALGQTFFGRDLVTWVGNLFYVNVGCAILFGLATLVTCGNSHAPWPSFFIRTITPAGFAVGNHYLVENMNEVQSFLNIQLACGSLGYELGTLLALAAILIGIAMIVPLNIIALLSPRQALETVAEMLREGTKFTFLSVHKVVLRGARMGGGV